MARADLVVRPDLVIPASELQERASRSSGPGGQHVNKTNTRVSLRWNVAESSALSAARRRRLLDRLAGRITRGGDLVVHVGRFRLRSRNRELARKRLVELVRGALAVRRRRVPTAPTAGSRQRALAAKKRRASLKRSRARIRRRDEE